ncbi:DUF317 domain-containing protein [Streptomyces niveus]|uniref:DUF317 domain-containing protein n=1 Tax=Streptomyces niveus TaxID=193462 RepID=UPI003433265D
MAVRAPRPRQIRHHWHASFTRDTPERLVSQFFVHLSTTAPVERAFRDVPHLVQGLGDALITPVRGAAVNPHVHHAAPRSTAPYGCADTAALTTVRPAFRP